MTTISYRRTLTLAAVFIVVSAFLIVMDRRSAIEPVRDGLSSVVSPVARGFMTLAHGPGYKTELEKELERVQNELDATRAENANLQAMIAEYKLLDEEQRVEADRPELNYLSATVIGQDPTSTQKYIVINKGSDDGIEVGMAVTDPDYFIGQVVEVNNSTSKVMLIIDTSASVGAQLMDTGADGIVVGQWQKGGRLEMQNVDRDAEVKEGAVVVTSGSVSTETRGVPPNIIIGTVFGDPIPTQRTNEVTYQVRPAVESEKLQTVWVVMPNDN
jgi:rod shape-determining protein MreC